MNKTIHFTKVSAGTATPEYFQVTMNCGNENWQSINLTPEQFKSLVADLNTLLQVEAQTATQPVALREVHLTRDVEGMCRVYVNGREAISDNGDVIDHYATPDWFTEAQPRKPLDREQRTQLIIGRYYGRDTTMGDLENLLDDIEEAHGITGETK